MATLTSSTEDEVSAEDDKWEHGAFTKVLLDALSARASDADHNGLISLSELIGYMQKNLVDLSDGKQRLGRMMRFNGDVFASGL